MSWRPVAAVVGFLLLWELAGQAGWLNPVLLSYPSEIGAAAVRLYRSGELVPDSAFTLRVFATSFTLALLAGGSIGFLIGYSSLAHDVLGPFIVVANSLPKIVLMPLIVLWLGIGAASNVFLGALMGSFPILMSVRGGVKSLDGDLIRLGRVYGASRGLMLRRIVLPGLIPFVLSGVRVAISYCMVGVLIAEFFGANQGLGYRMVLYSANFQVPAFFACIAVVAAVTLALTAIVHRLERRAEGWRPSAFEIPGM
jgi:NitT/TauT family transport system permease protein